MSDSRIPDQPHAVSPMIHMVASPDEEEDEARPEGEEKSWSDVKDGPHGVDLEDLRSGVCADADDLVQDTSGEAAQLPNPLPCPKCPSPEAMRRHRLTHWPYAPWCPDCVMARRMSEAHTQRKELDDRNHLLFVVDYCFVRGTEDEEMLTLLV